MSDLAWTKAAACLDSANCVEIAHDGDATLVRNSERPGDVLAFTAGEWAAFLEGVRAGEFNPASPAAS